MAKYRSASNAISNKVPAATHQMTPVPGTVQNNAGGFVYQIDKWEQFDRFLILGSEGGTYYVNEHNLT
jgi:60 kDa SS-A/Ro ribonucleoprotein